MKGKEEPMQNSQRPDFRKGFPAQDLADGASILGQVDQQPALLVRQGEQVFAVSAECTHYHGPLSEGLVVGETLRCPWHHACFSLRTGEALRAPALDPVACWRVDRVGDTLFVRERLSGRSLEPASHRLKSPELPKSVVIVGGGGAGLAAADMLRREGYDGPVKLISADDSPPYDRPNLSKDFLAGNAPDDWIPLRSPDYYDERKIQLMLKARVSSLDPKQRRVHLDDGTTHEFGALLLATGADPVRLQIEGATQSRLHYLRTFADSRAIVARAASAKRVAVVGASFIGLEVAASLRSRGIGVEVIAPESAPLERVLGPQVGAFIRQLHEARGVKFQLGQTVQRINGQTLILSNGGTVDADFVVLGVGVRPSLEVAQNAGLAIDRGILVNEYLETSVPGIFAAGDVARWPDPHSGERIRVEHWVVAQRQGQVAARNILGKREPFRAVPFFWSQHYDTTINYVGHAETWDLVEIDGDRSARDCTITYKKAGKTLAVVTISRDLQSLKSEAMMESAGT
jgi:NADPH-dependent 2,4-dienoyl-CoA reductase/sulfur reductase-like enzyme/nitrite reductase/ring-hydroxylating ferredoxin subunit